MIDERIQELSAEFNDFWVTRFEHYPRLQLDYSWPSLGLVDRLLAPLKLKPHFTEAEDMLVLGASAYIGVLTYQIWSAFPDNCNLSLTLKEGDTPNIILCAQGGKFLPHRARFTVNLSETLRTIIQNPPNPFPVFPEFSVPITLSDNIVSLFGRGLICGYTPFGEGGWLGLDFHDIAKFIEAAELICSVSCAQYYKRSFPGESLGGDAALYMQQLILPPFGFKEQYPGYFATAGLLNYFENVEASSEEKINLAINLCNNPDDIISAAGFILAASEGLSEPQTRLLTAREILGERALALKPAIICAKEIKTAEGNWLDYLLLSDYDKARAIYSTEQALDLLPLITLPLSYMKDAKYIPLWATLCFGDAEGARDHVDKFLKRGEANVDVIMQGVFLDLIMNQVEQAQKDLSLFANTQFTGDSPRYPLFNKLNGILALKQGKYEQAARYLQIAFDASLADPINASVLGNYLIATLIPQSKFEEALSITNQILQANSGSIMTMLNRSFILGSLDQSHESQKQLERAARIAPTDFRVFSQLTQNASLDR